MLLAGSERLSAEPQGAAPARAIFRALADHGPVVEEHGEPLFRFVQISDPHFVPNNTALPRALKQINEINPPFVVCTGDVTSSGTRAQFAAFKEVVSVLTMPLYCVVGNHDLDEAPVTRYEEFLGSATRAFTYKNSRFIILNTSAHKDRRGAVGEKQLAWLERELADCAEFAHVFVCGHHMLAQVTTPPGTDRKLAELFQKHKITAYLRGHTHQQGPDSERGVPTLVCPSVSAWNWHWPEKTQGYGLGFRINYVYADKMVSEFVFLDGGVDDTYRYTYPGRRRQE